MSAARRKVDLDAVAERCQILKLVHAAECLPELVEEASREDLSPVTFFDRVLEREIERKDERRIVVVDDPLAQMSQPRGGLQQNAGSSYGADFDTSTLSGALRFLPLGIAFLLFAPFPWAIESPLQMAAMPETLLWYPLFWASLIGLRASVREGRAWIPIAVLVCLACIYSLVEGNFGTAYRHRAQFMPIFFVFSGAGVNMLLARARLSRTRRSKAARAVRLAQIGRLQQRPSRGVGVAPFQRDRSS
jgi:hypothetical protein